LAQRTQDRAKQILHLLLQNGKSSVDALAAEIGMSAASVRRDLAALEKKGFVHRTYGAAELAGTLTYEAFRLDATFPKREERFAEEKRRIAMAAAALINEGDTVALAPGTTTTQVARNLRHRSNLHIVTSAVNIGMELSNTPSLQLTLTGGSVRWPGAFSMVGPTTYEAINRFFFDIAFLGVCGVHPTHGITVIEPEEAFILRAIVSHSKRVIVTADSSKLGLYSAARVCNLREVDTVITDTGLDPNLLPQLESQVKLQVV
jgi:DeoR family transcriptional regulator, aga operon transcriptional repressor